MIQKVKEFIKEKEKCGVCNIKRAVWLYMPGGSRSNPFYCDDCVPRGCSCEWNHVEEFGPPPADSSKWKWVIIPPGDERYAEVEEGEVWTHIDEKGREYPCCEYDYSEEGYEKD
jgi:hypothetical protein